MICQKNLANQINSSIKFLVMSKGIGCAKRLWRFRVCQKVMGVPKGYGYAKRFRVCRKVSGMPKGYGCAKVFRHSKYYLYVEVSGFSISQIDFSRHLQATQSLLDADFDNKDNEDLNEIEHYISEKPANKDIDVLAW